MQIQAYLDNVFDVGALLEDTETKNAVLEHMEELQEQVALVRAGPNLVYCIVGLQEGYLGAPLVQQALNGRHSSGCRLEAAVCLGSEFALDPNPESFWCLSQ